MHGQFELKLQAAIMSAWFSRAGQTLAVAAACQH